ncbi:MAG: serine/threonine-protein kinase [Polyangiaceae bacterium]
MSGPPPDASESEFDPLIGRTIGGKFVIERLLGAGAMGAVYRAHQTALERTVAIKVMHREIAADPTYAARFHREAKAVSRLDHPNLIRVLDYGQEPDGLLYIAMEFLDGRDLFTAINEEWPMPHDRIVDILSQTLSALAEAHDAGVLHRDLKPENIMLLRKKAEDGTPTDSVKVCDFGIAKVAEESEAKPAAAASGGRKLTAAGLVVGTPGYMAPEQARSEPCDARSDIYSVGVILYQLLTRRLPFEGNTPLDIVVKALHEAPPPLGSYGPTAAPGLEPICVKAMSKPPAERYQSARDMRAALRAAAPIERQIVISSGERPSIVNAPTQVELTSSAGSTGVRAVAATAASPARFWRAGGILSGLAIAGLALFSLKVIRGAPSATAVLAAAPSPSILTAVPSSAAVPPPTGEVVAPPPSVIAAPPPPSLSPSAPRPPNHHAVHEPKETMTIAPEAPQPTNSVPPTPPTPPEPTTATAAPTVLTPPAPAPTPTPAPPTANAAPPPPAPSPPTFNVATARVEIGQARTNNAAATGGDVSRAIAPFAARFTACYRTALAQATAATETAATLHVESDDQGYVNSARVTGPVPPVAARCIEGLLTHGARIEVDTGTANADVSLKFEPL